MILKFLRRLWVIYYYFIFGCIFILLYPFFILFLSHSRSHLFANHLRSLASRVLFPLTGIWCHIDYELKLNKNEPHIFCSNHTSHLDIPLFNIILNGMNYAYMGKAELAKIPLFNIFFKKLDIAVTRSSHRKSFDAYKKGADYLKNNVNLVIFPEGTSSEIAPELLKFKTGAFRLAIEMQVPIVPVTMLDNWRLFLDNGKYEGRPELTRVIVHKPIATKGMTSEDVENLKKKVFQTIDLTLQKYYPNQKHESR